ncbi:hypothetical protein Glove_212g23 [Diversispora epigaea]|uniref:F-box domain-containing protein n=1 Tax=Diversispora epigaea TaxID=1348612 RepID=A0A397IL63_9GLOM|nr:hypothetical protein Glove_212g23 [Diversispora epigaea]
MQWQSLAKAFNIPANKVDPMSNRMYINTLPGEILPDILAHISPDNHNLIQAVKVNYSLSTLNKVKNELDEVIKQHDISFYAFDIDIEHNNMIAIIA